MSAPMPSPDAAGTAAEYVFALPDLGEGLTTGEVIEWLVGVGEAVETDQPVVVVETVKSTVELPTPYRGRVTRLHAEPSAIVPVGAPLVSLSGPAGQEVAGGGTTHLVGQTSAPLAEAGSSLRGRLPAREADRGRAVASPVVRRLARELGVDLRTVPGTGPGSVVTRDDVRSAATASGPE